MAIRSGASPWTAHATDLIRCPRAFASGGQTPSLADTKVNLAKVLKEEMEYESDYQSPETLSGSVPGGFSVQMKDRDMQVTLVKEKDGELIEVSAIAARAEHEPLEDDLEDPDDEDIVQDMAMPFVVSVEPKGGGGSRRLCFECKAFSGELEVINVRFEDDRWLPKDAEEAAAVADMEPYEGPYFSELDETLQKALYDYLDARGINVEFSSYIFQLLSDKEQKEYARWLGDVHDFVSSK